MDGLTRDKEGGIDGRVDPRTGADERIDLVHSTGTRRSCVGLGKCHGHCTRVVARGLGETCS
jgi:hypothetical protein